MNHDFVHLVYDLSDNGYHVSINTPVIAALSPHGKNVKHGDSRETFVYMIRSKFGDAYDDTGRPFTIRNIGCIFSSRLRKTRNADERETEKSRADNTYTAGGT